jgi:hypothetical protein
MTAPDGLPLHALAEDTLATASPDLLRAMVKTFTDALMSAEAGASSDGRKPTSGRRIARAVANMLRNLQYVQADGLVAPA